MELDNKIHIDLIPEEKFSLKDFAKDIANDFNNEGILLEGKFQKGSSSGTFEDDLWILEKDMYKTYLYINFNELYGLKFKNIHKNDILAVKCWLADYLLDGYKPDTIHLKCRDLLFFINTTNNFSDTFLKENKGNDMDFLRKGRNDLDNSVFYTVQNIKEYINYRENIGFALNPDVVNQYLTGLDTLKKGLKLTECIREIPTNKEAIMFGYYIDLFFNDKKVSQELKIYYMPILIWWKISNVIPIRPSELCVKMKRDCLIEEDNRLYIKVDRIKRSRIRSKTKKRALLPTLEKLEISKEIHELISKYINLTNNYGETKTLFSYNALIEFSRYISEQYQFMRHMRSNANQRMNLKKDKEHFTASVLSRMLSSFYKYIIKEIYSDKSIKETLSLHDTRHYAFTSLMLQGLTPVEIALIGGHTTLKSQETYQSNVSYYVDHEIVNFIESKKLGADLPDKNLKDIVFRKSKECSNPLEQCIKTDDNIGYCTVDIHNENFLCENEEFCFKCSKWWCAPTEDNYDLLRKYIKNECVTPLEEKLAVEEEWLQTLINKANLINLDGVLRSNIDEDREFRTLSMSLKSDVDKLIDLKKLLLDLLDKERNEKEQKQIR